MLVHAECKQPNHVRAQHRQVLKFLVLLFLAPRPELETGNPEKTAKFFFLLQENWQPQTSKVAQQLLFCVCSELCSNYSEAECTNTPETQSSCCVVVEHLLMLFLLMFSDVVERLDSSSRSGWLVSFRTYDDWEYEHDGINGISKGAVDNNNNWLANVCVCSSVAGFELGQSSPKLATGSSLDDAAAKQTLPSNLKIGLLNI